MVAASGRRGSPVPAAGSGGRLGEGGSAAVRAWACRGCPLGYGAAPPPPRTPAAGEPPGRAVEREVPAVRGGCGSRG